MTLLRNAVVGTLLLAAVLSAVVFRLGAYALGWTSIGSVAVAADAGATPYAAAGGHAVGLRAVTIGDAAPIDGLLWYPADARTGVGSVGYTYGLKAFGDAPFALATYRGIGGRDAKPGLVGGPYPLVLLSPGFAFGAATYGWLAEHLASHGFVVLAMEHAEELDPSALWRATIDRPRDISAALDHADREGRDAWSRLVDPERVAVVGHSYGGYTALAAAGARLDTDRLGQICDGASPEDPILFQCDALMPHVDAMAAAAGLEEAPPELWPAWGEPVVDAAVALAGDGVMFGEAGMAEVDVPVMAIGGTADRDAPYEWGTQLAYEASSGRRKVEIGLEGAEHMIFTGPCETRRRIFTVLQEPFCADPAWDRSTAHDLVRHYVTAFLLAELNDDTDASAALATEATSVPHVRYAATGY